MALKRVTFQIEEGLLQQFKQRCRENGMVARFVVSAGMTSFLDRQVQFTGTRLTPTSSLNAAAGPSLSQESPKRGRPKKEDFINTERGQRCQRLMNTMPEEVKQRIMQTDPPDVDWDLFFDEGSMTYTPPSERGV